MIQLLPADELRPCTYFKKYLLSIVRYFDSKFSFGGLVWQVEGGANDRRRQLNAVVKWIFVAVQSTVLQHAEPLQPVLSRRLHADVHETSSQQQTV